MISRLLSERVQLPMAELRIKLFPSRAEQYPEPTGSDLALGAARAAVATIPLVGGSATEVLSMVLAPSMESRIAAMRYGRWSEPARWKAHSSGSAANGFRTMRNRNLSSR
jgi:hypothetical protein